jgi:hypothetical protein
LQRHSPPCTLPPSRGALLLPSIASQLTTANAVAVEKGKLRRTVPTAEEVLGLALAPETTIGQLLSPSDQDDLLAGIVSQADVLSIFSPPEEEIRREVTDRTILQGRLMDPDRLQVTVQGAS